MIPFGPKIKLVLAAVVAGALVTTGWKARGWYEDSQALAEHRGAQKAIEASMKRESRVAQVVEDRLAGLQANERIIDRGIIREIEKPIYKRVCLQPGAIRLLNSAADGDPTRLSAKPDDALPQDAAPSD